MKFTEYFPKGNKFLFMDEIRNYDHPWSVLEKIPSLIQSFLDGQQGTYMKELEGNMVIGMTMLPSGNIEQSLTVMKTVTTEYVICLPDHELFIEKGVYLEAGAVIKGPCIIGERSEIRQGAYLRGNSIIGNNCVVGHVTEVKNSIFMDNAHAGHFAYVGDSILGRHTNLGAGAKLANLQFRTRKEINDGDIKEIVINMGGDPVKTGRQKLGAIVGDYCEIGCNTVTAPGALLGSECWVYPNSSVPKGFHPSKSIIKNNPRAEPESKKK